MLNTSHLFGVNGADPYVTMRFEKGDTRGPQKVWNIKYRNQEPVWVSSRSMGTDIEVHQHNTRAEKEKCYVLVQLWGAVLSRLGEQVTGLKAMDTLIGELLVDVSSIPFHLPVPFKFPATNGTAPQGATIHMCLLPPHTPKKTVYFVRHGESTWNKAQSDAMSGAPDGLGAMLSSCDNPLNEVGISQAMDLQSKLKSAKSSGHAKAVQMLNAEAIFMSPLTRAVQTGLLGLEPVLKKIHRCRMMTSARERRNLGGLDTEGSEVGEAIMNRAISEAQPLLDPKGHEILDKSLNGLLVDISEVEVRWWDGFQESKNSVDTRMQDFMSQLQNCEADNIIVVGHSHYFRELFKQRLHPALSSTPLGKDLAKLKLMNAGVAAVTMDFSQSQEITSVELLFGTELVID